MQVQKYGIKWTKKLSGYYQSTTDIDGARRWLHRYTYEQERGPIPDGNHVHHVNGDKDNNDLCNLECLSGVRHREKHRADMVVFGNSPQQLDHLASIRQLAMAAKAGKYVSPRKLRKCMSRERACAICGEKFTPAVTSNDSAAYCSAKCSHKVRNVYPETAYEAPTTCAHCNQSFVPGRYAFGRKLYCSAACRDKYRYENRHITRKCASCGKSYHLWKGDAPMFCGECLESGASKHRHECACCGKEVLSRIKDGPVFCDRVCANKYRGLSRDAARLDRFKQAVREGRLSPSDRIPRNL